MKYHVSKKPAPKVLKQENMYENSMEEIYKAQNGNQEAMSKLVKQNSGLVWSIVKRFNSRGYELEDLYQIGSLRFSKSNKKI